jgi:hypothetical protein
MRMATRLKPEISLTSEADWLQSKLDSLPSPRQADDRYDWTAYNAAVRMLRYVLLNGARRATRADETWQGSRLSWLGITAISTGGFISACRKWIVKARKKAGEG